MRNPALVFWIVLAVTGSVAYGSWIAWRNATQREAPKQQQTTAATHVVGKPEVDGPSAGRFQLTERSGRAFDSDELKGKVWIGSVFFAACPGACWQMNQALKAVQDEITDPDLRLVSITCDPDNDKPEALTAYADRLHADRAKWLFLTGNMKDIQQIGREVLKQDIQPTMHTFHALVVDREGKIRGSFDMLDVQKVTELKTLAKELLDEKPGENKSES